MVTLEILVFCVAFTPAFNAVFALICVCNDETLEEIFANNMWQDLVNSFDQELGKGRLFECAMTCGSKLQKVWDQGGSKV